MVTFSKKQYFFVSCMILTCVVVASFYDAISTGKELTVPLITSISTTLALISKPRD